MNSESARNMQSSDSVPKQRLCILLPTYSFKIRIFVSKDSHECDRMSLGKKLHSC